MVEAKQRRIGDVGNSASLQPSEEAVECSKEPRSLRNSWLLRFIGRRGEDFLGVGIILVSIVLGEYMIRYVLLTEELYMSPVLYWAMLFMHYVLFGIFLIFWIRGMYLGAGSVPVERSSTVLPEELAKALLCGTALGGDFGRRPAKPFSPEDGWCATCERWKPAVASHCSTCRRCCLWMDHHCNFMATCIGFHNYRIFLCWLFYGMMLQALWFVISVIYWVQTPGADTWLSLGLRGGWACYLMKNGLSMRGYYNKCMMRIRSGWGTEVFQWKFECARKFAVDLRSEIDRVHTSEQGFPPETHSVTEEGITPKEAGEELFRCIGEVLQLGKRGVFYFPSHVQAVTHVFGEPPSWRWLLPFRGGTGDPLRPTHCDSLACSKWAKLGGAIQTCITLVRMYREGQQRWRARISGVIGGLDKEGP
mmetsp:Transcript_36437/g.66753  ORF Transcript_36437/g.66753 Transcript_36437/m.66753 type:complete len:420 (-) Transcript_36437:17-1276(-)